MRATALFWCLTLLHLQLRAAQQVRLVSHRKSIWLSSWGDQGSCVSETCANEGQGVQVQDTAQQGAPGLRTAEEGLGWGLIQLSGRVVRQGASCTDSSGQATVNMTVQEMPEGFGTAAVTCKFVPWAVVADLGTAPEQVQGCAACCACSPPAVLSDGRPDSWHVVWAQWKGKAVRANSSLQLAGFMEDVYNAEGSPALQTALVSRRHQPSTCTEIS